MQKIRDNIAQQLAAGTAVVGQKFTFTVSLSGLKGLRTFGSDIGHMGGWALGGFYRNPDYYSFYFNVAFLGSYDGTLQIIGIDATNRRALVSFSVSNSTSMESATRIPVIGYMPGSPVKSILSSKPNSSTIQIFRWSQVIAY